MPTSPCVIICMTNRARLKLYQQIARDFAASQNLTISKLIPIDTSWVEEPKLGTKLLTQALNQIKPEIHSSAIILKDAKWYPVCPTIKSSYPHIKLFCADIPISAVEHFAKTGNVTGLSSHLKNLLTNP